MKQIPLTAATSSTFDIDLDRIRYTFQFTYNARVGFWSINLSRAGVPLVTGQTAAIGVELFRGHANPLVPRNLYFVPLDQDSTDPNYFDLGVRVVLVQLEAGDGINV